MSEESAISISPEREAFEKWVRTAYPNTTALERHFIAGEWDYRNVWASGAWEAWNARPAPAVQVPEGMVHVPAERYEQLLACEDAMVSLVKTGCIPAEVAGRTLLAAAPTPAPVATEAVAQGGGVDVEKVMALVLEYGHAIEQANAGFYGAMASEAISEKAAQIRALLTAAPAIAKQEGK